MKTVVCVSLTDTLLEQIDNLRGDVSRSLFVEKLLIKQLATKNESMEDKKK